MRADVSRRQVLGAIYVPALAWTLGCRTSPSSAALRDDAFALLPTLANARGTPASLAGDEDFWREVQLAFTPDRSMVNLNNGGVCPSPAVVQASMKRCLPSRISST